MSIDELIDKTIETMLGEDTKTITDFLGYKPDNEVLNNNQLLEEELSNAADQMSEDVLVSFYEKTQKKSKAEARDRNDLIDHLINLVESDDKRYSFEWSCGNAMGIYDKEKEVGYVLHINKIEYDADGNATNL